MAPNQVPARSRGRPLRLIARGRCAHTLKWRSTKEPEAQMKEAILHVGWSKWPKTPHRKNPKANTRNNRGAATLPAKSGKGGELHQSASSDAATLTTNQGTPISDNQNSLRAGSRGPAPFSKTSVFREKITHFDHERIPERIVHARGSGAHGFFQPYRSMAKLTRAALPGSKGHNACICAFFDGCRRRRVRRHAAGCPRVRREVLHVRGQLRPGGQQHPRLLYPRTPSSFPISSTR